MFFRKKERKGSKQNTEDILLSEKSDRRLLSYVPDRTKQRTGSDRRGAETNEIKSFSDLIAVKKAGIRYQVTYEVSIKVRMKDDSHGKRKYKFKGTGLDVSTTGILVRLPEEAKELLLDAKSIRLKFSVLPGSMPEGYEMKVNENAKVARTVEQEDGTVLVGFLFDQNLHFYAARRKDRNMLTISALLLAFITMCILLMRAESFIYFKANKWLYLYSILAAIFLLSRYIFAIFYRPVKVDPDFTPGVTILIPCFNEEEWIDRTIISCMNQDYPVDKLEVIVIDDCSTDHSVQRIRETIALLEKESERFAVSERLKYLVQEKNAGKRDALVRGAIEAKHELCIFVDSDSFLDPFAVRNLVQPFRDPKMGGVAGRTDVANTYTNALTKMQSVRYYIAFRVMKAAEGLFDCVTCLSGPLSCYRKDIIMKHKDDWLNQSFLGQKATFGDDRAMTNFVLRHHRTTYQDTAICSTIVPNRYSAFLKQQMRWKRSWLRESLMAGLFIWRKEPFASVTFYMGLVVPIIAPIVVVYNLIYVPITQHIFPTAFLMGLLLMAMMMSMAQMLLRKSTTWIFGMLFCIYYEAVLLWQMPIAWFTFWKSTWGTRMTPEDVKEAEEKAARKAARKANRVSKKKKNPPAKLSEGGND